MLKQKWAGHESNRSKKKKKVESHMFVRRRGSHII
jgi:hypothetical protein